MCLFMHTDTGPTSNVPGLDFLGSFVTRDPTISFIMAAAGVGARPLAPALFPPSFFAAAAEMPLSAPGVLGNRSTIGGGAGAALWVAGASVWNARRGKYVLHR